MSNVTATLLGAVGAVAVLALPLGAEPPFNNIVYLAPNMIMAAADPAVEHSLSYRGRAQKKTYHRVDGWVVMNAYGFAVEYRDSVSFDIWVHPDLGHRAAERLSRLFATEIGRLPKLLRRHLENIWVYDGSDRFGTYHGPNEDYRFVNMFVSAGETAALQQIELLEEVLLHELIHVSIQSPARARDPSWARWNQTAVKRDASAISNYAQSNPLSEDLVESFHAYFIVDYRPDRVSPDVVTTIRETIPNRLEYLRNYVHRFPGLWCPIVKADCPSDSLPARR